MNIRTVYFNPTEMKYAIVGVDIPVQMGIISEYSEWSSVMKFDGELVFDMQLDFDDSVKLKNELEYYQCQFVNLIKLDEPKGHQTYEMGEDWQNPEEFIITEQPINNIIAEMISNETKVVK